MIMYANTSMVHMGIITHHSPLYEGNDQVAMAIQTFIIPLHSFNTSNTCNVSIQRAHAVSFLGKLLRSFKTFLWRSAGSPADLANVFNLSRITKVERNCPHCPRNCPHFPVIDICPQCPYSPKYLSITLFGQNQNIW